MSKFPENFLWGAGTSGHQVEGGNINDWTEYEKQNAQKFGVAAKKKWLTWQQEKFPEMFEQGNYISGKATDHYHRYAEDFSIAKELGHNAHRFSLEWSRIEPMEGQFDEGAIEHYRSVLYELKRLNIEPFITLWHWTIPLWFRDKGGWAHSGAVECFRRYVTKIVEEFGSDVIFWIPINEPNIYVGLGCIRGSQPPATKNPIVAIRTFKNLIKAHNVAYLVIKEKFPKAEVGLSPSIVFWDINPVYDYFADLVWNRLPVFLTKKYCDFVGINYYTRNSARQIDPHQTEREINDLGWEIEPSGIFDVAMTLKRYNKPLYVTENGIADAYDSKRSKFIKDHVHWMKQAINSGADIRGYFYWSLLDNFEFVEVRGFWPRFGLVEVDYSTMERKIRPSAWEYKKIIEEGL